MTCHSPSGHCDQTVCEVENRCAWPAPPSVAWAGEFGNAYTTRNRVDWRKRVPFWYEILRYLDVRSILEVGCNVGFNLTAIRAAYPFIGLHGIDVNNEALLEARAAGFDVRHAEGKDVEAVVPFDLVATVGVLIHVPPADLEKTMQSIVRASRRYVLAVEYEAEQEEEIEYRGQKGLLWKRPFGKLYQDMGLKLVGPQYVVGPDQAFDNCTVSLLEKP